MSQPVAIVTGAGRGIGRATAIELSQRGYRLTLVSRTASELEQTAQMAGDAFVVPADVTDPNEAERIVALTLQRYNRLDALVNNAGLAPVRSIEQMTIDEWRATIDTNLSATFYFSRSAWPTFKKQKAGVIVNISSAASRDPFPGFAAYGAAKAGVNLLGLSLAREGEPIGVRVHTLALSAAETEMFRQIVSPDQYPTEKTMSPADVAKVIALCVTGELRHTSGEVIYLHKTL
jgi:NAD(P)-dependent dehydrogenase (short-subunit alcohol dehydrogenase family)